MIKTFKVIEIGKLNKNNRIYNKETATQIVETFKSKAKDCMFGEEGHPEYFDTSLSKATHVVKDIRIEGNYVVADIKLLNTASGNHVKSIMEEFPDYYSLSPRSAGTIDEKNTVNLKKFFTLDLIPKDQSAFEF